MLLGLLIGLPAAVGLVLVVVGHPADRRAAPIAVATALAGVVLAAVSAVLRPEVSAPLFAGIRAGFAVDDLSAALVVTVTTVLTAVLIYATGELGVEQSRARFHGLMLVFGAAMLAVVTATGLAVLLMSWEVMGATSYALIGFWWSEPRRVASGEVAFVTTRAGDLGLYLAAGAAVAGGVPGLELARLPAATGVWPDVVAGGIVLAALGKSAQLPFSFWLSRAMDGPSPVSALLHSATMVAAGAYLLLRTQPLLVATVWPAAVVAWVGVITALALGAVALAQRDLKQLLAASTCSQIGFMVLAAGTGELVGGVGQLIAHAATKSLLFLGAGAWLAALGTKNLTGLRGAARRHPGVGLAFTVGALTLAGVPPLSLWVTKDAVLAAALGASPWLYLVGLAAVAVSAAYAGRIAVTVWLPPPRDPEYDIEQVGTRRIGAWRWLPMPVLALAAAMLGLGGPGAGFAAGAQWTVEWWEPVVTGVISLGAVLLAGWLTVRGRQVGASTLAGWLGLERIARRLVGTPTLALARWLAAVDDRVVDGGVTAVAAAGSALARLADRRAEFSVDAAVRGVSAGARVLGGWARRPQTGQLHHYYAQTAIGVLLLAALLVVLG